MNDADARIRKTISKVFGIPESSVVETSDSFTLMEWDSLNHVQLIMALEAEFGVSFEAEQALTLTSVVAIRDAVSK